MESIISHRLATLGHPKRLAIFRLLVRHAPDLVAAGDIGQALDVRPSTLSAYLSALMQAGLVTQTRAGTSLRYTIATAAMRETLDYLTLDCCRGRPDLCLSLSGTRSDGPPTMTPLRYNVLFICTGNSARSIFAESILRQEAGDQFTAHSAGTRPFSEINPTALEMLTQKGHDTSPLRAKTIAEFQGPDAPRLDFVFTVCNRAADEECPAWDGQPISSHWGLPDPVRTTGTDAEKVLAFQETYGALRNRITTFAALPLRELDRISLQAAVDRIAADPVRMPA